MSSSIELLYSLNTELHFATFLSGGFITALVVNPLERKLAKCISVHCLNFDRKDLAESTLHLSIGWLPYSRKHKHVSFSDMSLIATPPNGDPKGYPKGDPKENILI